MDCIDYYFPSIGAFGLMLEEAALAIAFVSEVPRLIPGLEFLDSRLLFGGSAGVYTD